MEPDRPPKSELVQKGLPCDQPDCNSSDAVALYDDGHRYCFSCGHFYPADGQAHSPRAEAPRKAPLELAQVIDSGSVRAIKSRKLTQESCAKWDYRVRQISNGSFQQLATYRDQHGSPVGVKIRDTGPEGTDKEFSWVGSAHENLYGRHLWGQGGRRLVILEGEIDTITVSQCNDHKYPVVGVPNGAHEAAKAVAHNLEWINTFDVVVFGFDMDPQGREACVECAALLPPGKAFIASWGDLKDPNDLLKAGRGAEITQACWNAKAYRPDGIIDARDLTERCMAPVVSGIPWPWPFMTKWTYGRRDGEVYTLGAGTGIGKTDWMAEVVACTINGKDKDGVPFDPEGVAIFGYESGAAETKNYVAGKLWSRRFHIPQDDSGQSWTEEEKRAALAFMDHDCWDRGGRLFINDSFGAASWDDVRSRARFLAHSEGIKHFFVDPISALVTGVEDERKLLDKLVLEASSLAQELSAKVYLLSHLTRPGLGASHEEGGHVALNQFRGSNGIGMFSHFVFGLERNQQHEEEAKRAETVVRVVKDRYTGNSTGKTDTLIYDVLHGTLDIPVQTFVGDV